MTRPLAGLTVIDFTHVLAGPACAYYLGLLGAEVIKIERPGRGDAMRHRGGTDKARAAKGMSTSYITQASGKHSVTCDLETEAGRARLNALLERADVFIENHRPETLARLGFDWPEVHARFPRLIHCALTGYGRGGPLENAPAYDINIQAISGLMAMTGTPDTGPLRTGAPVVDYGVALAAGFAIAAALVERGRTGVGRFIDVSMLETAFTLMSAPITDYVLTGNEPRPRGNAANSRSPSSGVFACGEGLLSLGVNEESQFASLARALEREDWLTDPRYATRGPRDENGTALGEEIAAVLATRTAAEWEERLHAAGVPSARLRTMPEALAMPHVQARQYMQEGDLGIAALPGLPFRFGDGPRLTPQGPIEELGASDDMVSPRNPGV